MSMDLGFFKWIKSVIGFALYVFHLSELWLYEESLLTEKGGNERMLIFRMF